MPAPATRGVVLALTLCAALSWAQSDADEWGAAPAASAAPEARQPAAIEAPVQTADEAFTTRVKTLEENVVDLKEKIFRTKARLLLLQETVLGGDLSSGARAVIVHKNDMGPQFILESVAYALDGAPIFTRVDATGDLDKKDEFEIFNGRIVPGNHQIAVRMVYRGHGFGIFSYMEGYKFKLQSNQTFNAEAGKITTVKVSGYEKGGITADIKDKPSIGFEVTAATDERAKKEEGDAAGTPAAK